MKDYIPLMSEAVLGERLKADEATTTIALQNKQPLSLGDDLTWEAAEEHAMAMIRTGAVYILPVEHIEPAMRDLPPTMELPPLPFPRVVIEAEMNGKPCEFLIGDGQFGTMGEKLITILEVARGEEWNIVFVLSLDGKQEYFAFGIKSEKDGNTVYMPKGMTEFYNDSPEALHTYKELRSASVIMMGFVINLAHLITAKNAPKERQQMIRQQRRAFKRKFLVEPPSVYRVKLEQAGDQEGSSGWHYMVRFLVCGHWRHFADGTRTWIAPYIKGPAGAPWKGRPVHEKEETAHG